MSSRLTAVNEAALAGARLFASLRPACDYTINELPSGVPVQPSDLIAIYRDETRQAPVSAIFASIGREWYQPLSGSAFTPVGTGVDSGSIFEVPYAVIGGVNNVVPWTVQKITFWVVTAGSAPASMQIARSIGTGPFVTANFLNATPLASGSNESTLVGGAITLPGVNSGDKLAVSYNSVGTGVVGFFIAVTATANF